jgi:hypothetical protein
MILGTLLTFLIPLFLFASVTSTPVKHKPKYNHGKVYSVVLLDKNGEKIRGYTYIK